MLVGGEVVLSETLWLFDDDDDDEGTAAGVAPSVLVTWSVASTRGWHVEATITEVLLFGATRGTRWAAVGVTQ